MEDPRISKYKNVKKLKNKTSNYIEKEGEKKNTSIYESQSSILKNWINFVKGKKNDSSFYNMSKTNDKVNKENFNGFIRKENRVTKIAKYFLAIGLEKSAEIMSNLEDEDIISITKEIAKIKFISSEERKSIIEKFDKVIKEEQKKIKIKKDFAYELLNKSFGKSKAKEIYKKVTGKDVFIPFDYLSKIEHQQLWSLLRNENSKTLAIIYNYLNKDQKKFIFSMMDGDLKKSFVKELVKPKKLNVDTIEFISNALKKKVKFQGTLKTEKLDGSKILVDILSYMDAEDEKTLLNNIDMKTIDPSKDNEIKEKIFNIDIILRIKDNDLHNILKDFTDKEIATIIKGKSEDIKLKILSNVSKRRKLIILDEELGLKKIKTREENLITTSFLHYIKALSQKREIVIYRKNEEFL